jgi:glycosidase
MPRGTVMPIYYTGNKYIKVVNPVEAGIQNRTGCRIKAGMTFYMFNRRSNRNGQKEHIGDPLNCQHRTNLPNLPCRFLPFYVASEALSRRKNTMPARCAHPILYEINTWVWLGELSRRYGSPVNLGSVPAAEWDAIADLGIDLLWLMGVWERSPAGAHIAIQNQGLLADFMRALPDFAPADNIGSPYCIRRYVVDKHLGGPEGLAEARRRLAERNIVLMLDFVPNHVAPDHPWVAQHPEYFIQGRPEDARREPGSFMWIGDRAFACGRDPHYPAWPDVLQLNAFHAETRRAMTEAVLDIAAQCDGVRCDMAMLVMNSVFAKTWGPSAGEPPVKEYWTELIQAVRRFHQHFLFVAEAYWDLEWQLQQEGFDFCYDKRLYDRLERDSAESIRLHLCAERAYQDRLVRFIENHDEPRAAVAFPARKAMAAALTAATIPGVRLFHEGQFTGRKIRLPVFLGRRPDEAPDPQTQDFYGRLLEVLKSDCLKNGQWRLCERIGRQDDPGVEDIVAWCWSNEKERYLIVVNLSDAPSRGWVRPVWGDSAAGRWTDLFTGNVYEIGGDGFYADLPAWGFHVLRCAG